MSLESDDVVNAIYLGIKEDIRFALNAGRLRAAVILIYSGIDTMAWIGMDAGKQDVDRGDFVAWTDKYIRFECPEQLTGLDLYGARWALLHNSSVYSKPSREGRCRTIAYGDQMVPAVQYAPSVSTDVVVMSIQALGEAFFQAIDRSVPH
jgi:hypothetical protein